MTEPAHADVTAATALVTAVTEFKPRLRGWLHAYAAAVSIVSGATLVGVAAALRGESAGTTTAIYAATVTLLFGTSALYHRIDWGTRARAVMKRLDHSMIFVFIAGTYTPIAVLTLPRGSASVVLTVVWAGAVIGVVLKSTWPSAPTWLSVPCYIALGWVAVFVMPELLRNAGVAALVLIAAGGVFYTVGGIVYGLKRPNPLPGVLGFHEVFHVCTLVAAICHYVAIWLAVFR
ncbi:MAG: hemolysin [Pseudonocardiales bacterium]|jgi:hemolysin III|nr:hemolysin [Pseudonocardiales bacterium]